MQEGFVLLVGFYRQRLVAILGDFALLVLNGAFVLSLGRFVGLNSCLRPLQAGFGSGKFFFNRSHPFGQRGDFLIQAENFAVRLL